MKKKMPVEIPPLDRIAALRVGLDDLERQIREDPRALGEVPNLPAPPSESDVRELVVGVHAMVQEFLVRRDFLKVQCVPMTLAVRTFICGLDDELRMLARKIHRLQRTDPQFFLRSPIADLREAFRQLCFEKVDLDNPPDEASAKKNYKALSVQYHPDRTGHHESGAFVEVQKAWEAVQTYYENGRP